MRRRAMEIGTAIVGLGMVGHIVLRPNSANLITNMSDSIKSMVNVAAAGNAVHSRRDDALNYLTRLGTEEQTELYAGLLDEDLDWVIEQLGY